MHIKKFKDCIAWKKSREITNNIYAIFRTSKDYSFRDQIQKASVSVMNNIAEGFGRNTDKELRIFYLFLEDPVLK